MLNDRLCASGLLGKVSMRGLGEEGRGCRVASQQKPLAERACSGHEAGILPGCRVAELRDLYFLEEGLCIGFVL